VVQTQPSSVLKGLHCQAISMSQCHKVGWAFGCYVPLAVRCFTLFCIYQCNGVVHLMVSLRLKLSAPTTATSQYTAATLKYIHQSWKLALM
jgi:hypothetical protein